MQAPPIGLAPRGSIETVRYRAGGLLSTSFIIFFVRQPGTGSALVTFAPAT